MATDGPQALASLDAHVHLWPNSAANQTAHAWMTPDNVLTRAYTLEHYQQATQGATRGLIYVETDRSQAPPNTPWQQPLDELQYLASLASTPPGRDLLKGVVAWTPLLGGAAEFHAYRAQAQQRLGPAHGHLLKGFRHLLQGLTEREAFARVALGAPTLETLLAMDGYSFDLGVDARSRGVWQLQLAADLVRRVRARGGRVTFVVDHLGKPDFAQDHERSESFAAWAAAVSALAAQPHTYMKLSGALTELQAIPSPSAAAIWARIAPWVRHVFAVFGPGRVIFGSDWPVCNVAGLGDDATWRRWRDVVDLALDELACTDHDRAQVLGGTAQRAYHIANIEQETRDCKVTDLPSSANSCIPV